MANSQSFNINPILGNPVFNALLLARLIAAFFAPIMDCDEVFNYWDPTHYLTHGFGLQTWEYSPEYAIRSWFYAGLHALVILLGSALSGINSLVGSNSPSSSASLFYFVRSIFGALAACADWFLYLQIKQHLDNCIVSKTSHVEATPSSKNNAKSVRFVTENDSFASIAARPSTLFLIFSIAATGYFHASISYLPSSFAMVCFTVSLGYLIQYASTRDLVDRAHAAVKGLSILAFGGIVGWPFALALAPYWGLHILFSSTGGFSSVLTQRHFQYVSFIVSRTAAIVGPILILMVAFDSFLYGKLSVVPLNIVLYNVLFADSESGPDIFGTEPWHYYIQNLILNFNIGLPLAFISPLAIALHRVLSSPKEKETEDEKEKEGKLELQPIWHLIIAPFFVWYAIFTLQPHKEERFMYVAYSSLVLNASLSASVLSSLVPKLSAMVPISKTVLRYITPLAISIVFVALSFSRSLSLTVYYNGPIQAFAHISQFNETITGISDSETYNVCIGREWYRFPSSYFLPNNARLQFIPSGFNGLLPGQFLEAGDLQDEQLTQKEWLTERFQGIWTPPVGMNNKNLYDAGKVVPLESCTFVVDSSYKVDEEVGEVDFKKALGYKPLFCTKLLDTGASKGLARLLYLPSVLRKLTKSELVWTDFCVYQRKTDD